MTGSLKVVRAAVVLVVFVVAVAILVAIGTRPTTSNSSSAQTTLPTTTVPGGSTTSTTAAAGGAASTTTTAAHGHGHGSTTTTAPHSTVSVVVANATSANGLAAHYSTVIGAGGWKMQTPVDAATKVPTSAVYYASGQQQAAATIATAIGVKPTQVLPLTTSVPVSGVTGNDVVVVIGQDLATTSTGS